MCSSAVLWSSNEVGHSLNSINDEVKWTKSIFAVSDIKYNQSIVHKYESQVRGIRSANNLFEYIGRDIELQFFRNSFVLFIGLQLAWD